MKWIEGRSGYNTTYLLISDDEKIIGEVCGRIDSQGWKAWAGLFAERVKLGIYISPEIARDAVEAWCKKPDERENKCCPHCIYYNREEKTCHRNPPIFVNVDSQPVWPPVAPTDWCGEFKVGEYKS